MDNRKKGFMLSGLVVIISIVFCYLIYVTLQIPYIGVAIEQNESGKWQISYIDHLGWATRHGIKVGDIVTRINQTKPGEYSTVLQYGVIEQADTIEIDRKGEAKVFTVTNDLTPELVIYHAFIPALVFVILLIFSCFLYLKKRNDKSAQILIFFFLALGFCYLSAGGSSRKDFIAIYINRISLSFIPALFLEFLRNYFMRYGACLFNRKLLFALYGVNGLLLIIGSFFLIFGRKLSIIRNLFLTVFLISILLCLYILISRYIRYRKTVHKPIFKIMLVGVSLAFFPFVFLVGIPNILFGVEIIPAPVAAVFLIFLPIVFIYLITANRLLDIDFVMNRLCYYSILSFFPTIFLVLLFTFLWGSKYIIIERIQLFLITYTVLIGFLYTKEQLDFRFRSKLFREKHNFHASLDRFSQHIAGVMKVSQLEEQLLAEVREVLSVKSISLLVIDMGDLSISLKRGNPNFPSEALHEWLKSNARSISIGEVMDIGNGAFFPVGRKGKKHFALWIDEKLNRTQLNQEERVWLKTIAHYVSLVYENLHLIEGLTEELEEALKEKNFAPPWILRLVFNISEKERRRLASDLHDSALQDQLLWYRKLEPITSDQRVPPDIRKQLTQVKEGLLDVIHQIRETCNELRPPFLKDKGIVESLKDLFHNVHLRANYVVYFDATNFNIDLDDEKSLAIYRIVQELLTNASKHSKASRVDISLENDENFIRLNYKDNGIGMDLTTIEPSVTHMGLSGIMERVSSLEGEAKFYSSVGSGFEVSICLPINMANVFEQVVERGEGKDDSSITR